MTFRHFQKKLVPSLLMPVCFTGFVNTVQTDATILSEAKLAAEAFSACDNIQEVDTTDLVSGI